MRYKRKKKLMPFIGFLVFAVLASFGSSDAFQLKPGDDTTIDCDISFIYGAGWRASGQDRDKLKNANIDDGDRNFEKWDMYNNKGTLLADIDMKFKNTGLFVRPKAFYDHVYMTKNANDSAATNNALKKVPADITKTDDWDDEVKDVHGRNWEILDLFAYTNFDLADKNIEFRVGKQVISWGESLFISGGISSAQSHVDAAASVAVGTEVKEIFLPSESVYLHAELAPSLALSGYYQWKWRKTKLMEGGSFFATSADFLDDLKAPILLGGPFLATRIGDDDPKDSGQFGAALTYVWDWLNATEIGLYYINYHDKAPTVHYANYFSPAPGLVIPKNYYLSYTENIKLYGASFSSLIGDMNLSGEVSYRKDYGFAATKTGTELNNYYQAQTSWTYAVAFDPFADQIATSGEIACVQTIGRAKDVFAWQYIARLAFTWYQVLKDLDVVTTFAYNDFPSGTFSSSWVEGASRGSVRLDFTYKNIYKAAIAYEQRYNSKRNSASDRDTLALSLSYTF